MIFRVVNIVLVVALIALCGMFAMGMLNNPGEAKRHALNEQLVGVNDDVASLEVAEPVDNAAYQNAIIKGGSLWKELIPPPQLVEQPPDLKAILQGVVPTRVQVGDRVRIETPNSPRGDMYGVGDSINGARIKAVAGDYVEFALPWKDQELTLRIARN